jgi:flagellin
MRINSNIPAAIANNALNINNRNMATAMERLSTGKRINSGEDDPAGIAVAARLEATSRAQRMGVRNANDAISMLQTYSTAGQTILNLVIRMKEIAVQGSTTTLQQSDWDALDQEYNQLGAEWLRIAQNTRWNGQAGMNSFDNTFTVRIGDGATQANPTNSTVMLTLRNWNPTHNTANQNVTGATAAAADDTNASVVQAFNFVRNQNHINAAPVIANARSFDHIQSRQASTSAVAKLDSAVTGMTRELANNGAYVNRLQISADNLTAVATSLEKSRSQVEDADYALESTELARTQIIAQAATAMLAQANASPQTILALLQ